LAGPQVFASSHSHPVAVGVRQDDNARVAYRGDLKTCPAHTVNSHTVNAEASDRGPSGYAPLLDPGTTSWPEAIPVVAVALLLLFLPGLIAALLLRAPWLAAVAVAPALSTTAVVSISVVSSAADVQWGPLPLIVGVLTVWLLAAALGALLAWRAPPEERSRLPIAVLMVTAFAAIAVALVLLPVSLTPEAFPQHPDTIFHLGVAQTMVEQQDASVFHAEAFRRTSGNGFYQAAFHAMVATITQLSGASVVVSTSSFVLVIAGVAWPLGCIFLARTLFGPDLAVTLSAGVASVAFSAYPFVLMGYGVLWPNLFGQTLLPGALGMLAIVASAAHPQSPPLKSKLRAMVLLLAMIPGLTMAHPNALLTFLLFGYLMVAGVLLAKAWEMRRGRPWLPAVSAVGLLMATGLAFASSSVVDPKGGMRTATVALGSAMPRRDALYSVLLFAPRGAAKLWFLAALVAVGAGIILWRHRDRWWIVAALMITSALLYVNLAIDTPTARLFTWPWNNQAPRLAAIGVLPAVLLATVALATGARLLKTRVALPQWASAVAAPLILVLITGGAYVNPHRQVLDPYFHPTAARSWASNAELRALHSLARHIPPDAVVAENPWNGGSYMYVVSGRLMLFPTEKDRLPGDRMLLALRLNQVGSSPEVCAAARRQQVRFAITGGRPFASAGRRGTTEYKGVDAVGSSDAFVKVAKDGPYTLYKMIRCAEG